MRVILIDDEPMALVVLNELLSKYKDIYIIASYTDVHEAIDNLNETKPDVIFLDIEMGDINGLKIASVLNNKNKHIEIVFVTAYSSYALEAFELNAIDYLQKPVQEDRMKKTIQRLREKFGNLSSISTNDFNIKCFGELQILDDFGNPVFWRTQKAKELFLYLWYKNAAVSKDLIINDIFPDKNMEKAVSILHTTIYQLRKGLKNLGYNDAIEYLNDSYRLNIPLKSDYLELKEISKNKEHSDEDIEKILNIYNGDFFEMEEYLWAMENRQKYTRVISDLLENYAARILKQGKLTNTVSLVLDKLLKIDPYNENAAKMKIVYIGKTGNRAELQKFYKSFKTTLLNEIGVQIEQSTEILFNKWMR